MIDPDHILNTNRSSEELEELLLFCIAVAGHSAHPTAKAIDRFLEGTDTPFAQVRKYSVEGTLSQRIRDAGLGCHTKLVKAFEQLVRTEINLKTCTLSQLEAIHGIGPKTSRFFLLYSRVQPGRIAVLDRHVLRYMSELGIDVPKSTPSGSKYLELEQKMVEHVESLGLDMSKADLDIWVRYRKKSEES